MVMLAVNIFKNFLGASESFHLVHLGNIMLNILLVAAILIPLAGRTQTLTPNFDRSSVEKNLIRDTKQNLRGLQNSPNFALWSSIISQESERAGRVPTVPVSADQVDRILCDGRAVFFDSFLARCNRNLPPADYNVFLYEEDEEQKLRTAFSIWSDLPSRKLFVSWLLSDILVFASGRTKSLEVTVENNSFVYEDALLESYFSDKLRGMKDVPIGAKFLSLSNAVELRNGLVETSLTYFLMISQSFMPHAGLVVDRSQFGPRIGEYTFLMQLLFMNYSAQFGLESRPRFFAGDLLKKVLLGGLNMGRWAAWAELFAFPEVDSPRNVEYWKEVLFLKSKNALGVVPYLDVDKRASAPVITPSLGSISFGAPDLRKNPVVTFNGQLGAIASANSPGQFVGFAGIEIKAGLNAKGDAPDEASFGNEGTFGFNIEMLNDDLKFLSVELGIDRDGIQEQYFLDLPVQTGINRIRGLSVNRFERSIRGTGTGTFLEGANVVRSYRFFFKRSLNNPTSTRPLPVGFSIDLGTIGRSAK